METKPKNTYKPSKTFDYYLCILAGFGCLIGSYFLLSTTLKKTYPQLPEIVLGIGLILFGLYCIYFYLNRKTIYEFKDYFLLKSGLFLSESKIRKDEIQSWAEIHKISKHADWDELFIFTASKKYYFSSYHYDCYSALKSQLTKNKARNVVYEEKADAKSIAYFSLVFLIIGLLMLGSSCKYYLGNAEKIDPKQYATIEEIVTSEIKIKREGKSSRYINLKLNDYPDFKFRISCSSFYEKDIDNFVSNVSLGDTLTVTISKEKFDKKITKTEPLSFWDKSFNYNEIKVFEVSHKGSDYLTLADYEEIDTSRKASNNYWFAILGTLFLGLWIVDLIKRKNSRS